jgi:thioredoxin 1
MVFDTPIHTNEQSIERVLRAGVPVVLVFWSRPCPPCEQLDPLLERLAADYAGKALIAKVDVRDNPGLVRRYGITHLPGLVFVRQGAPVAQGRGAASEAVLRAWLEHLVTGRPRPSLPEGPSVPLGGAAPRAPEGARRPAAARGAAPTPGAAPLDLTDATFDQVVGSSAQPVLVDFWAPWCGPCRMIEPTIMRLAQEFAGRATVARLNVDENPRTAQRFNISSIPALLIFRQGQVVERLFGAQPAPVIRQALAKHAGAAG